MDFEFKSIKALFKGKINPKSTNKRYRHNNVINLPLCYTIDNKNIRNYSFTKKMLQKKFIRNKDLSICSNNCVSSTNITFNNKKILDNTDITKKKSKNIKSSKVSKQKENIIQNYCDISVNKSLHQSGQNRMPKKELKHKKTNINKNTNNISYIAHTPKNSNLLRRLEQTKLTLNERSKMILVKKNKKLLESKSNNQKDKHNFSTYNELNYFNKLYNNFNNDYNKINNCNNINVNVNNNVVIENNIKKNILPYKKKKIMNKQFLNLRLNFMNESQKIPDDKYQCTNNNVNNLEICGQPYYKIDSYMNKSNNRCYSLENRKSKKDIFEKNIDIDIGTNQYNVKNININFNNIKVVNNLSKKYSSVDIDKKKKHNENKEMLRNKEISLNNEINSLDLIQDSEIGKRYITKKIKVSKTKSSLKRPEDLKESVNYVKIVKKKIIKGKSENNIKVKKKIRIMKIDSCTIEGKSFKQKYNQENFFMNEKFLNKKEQFLIGICNGHGKHGKLISKYIINSLPTLIKDTSNNEIINAFLQMNNKIINENNKVFDCSLSGASCISLIISLDKIISANLGDNKAILARYENGLYNYVNLNREHKPTMPDEKKRILEHNGKIGHLYEKSNSPKKVWLKNSDIPGLPISRSFGDSIAHSVGVISEPEIKSFYYNGNGKFIILASHGFWDIIDGEESVEIVKEFYENNLDAIGALNKLALEILNKTEFEERIINEDITIIIVFFE